MIRRSPKIATALAALLLTGAVSGCLVGPTYRRPTVATFPAFKEADGWTPAHPSDAADRKDWWTVFGDATLDDLERRVDVSNQTLAAAEAAYRQAHALVAENRAALFPTIALDGSATAGKSVGVSGAHTTYQPNIGGTWAPDIWGAVRRGMENARASAQSSAALVVNARLSVQTALAVDYIQLRQFDEEKRLLDATAVAYARTLSITENKYTAGVAARGDVLAAQSQLQAARANVLDIDQQRARTEHAIAILAGEAPAALTLPPAPWNLQLPDIPATVPSTLIERRPDIAAAERLADAANAQIGVQTAAYFPNLTLSGQGGFAAGQLGPLFNASNSFWSVGALAAETVFDAGARQARVAGARAAYDQAVANYRQTVLTALGQVEDNLAAQRVLAAEQVLRRQAADAADAGEVVARNEYAAGTVDYTTVVVAEANALADRNAELAIEALRLTTAVSLIEALGGGWSTAGLARS